MSQSIQPYGTHQVDVLQRSSYVARRNFFNFFGITCRILDAQGLLLAFVKLRAFKLREQIGVFADEAQTQPVLHIQARSIIDFSATYDVTDARSGAPVGSLRRRGWKSLMKDEWELSSPTGEIIGRLTEDSTLLALLRRFLSALIPQNYHLSLGAGAPGTGPIVGRFIGTWNPFIVRFQVDLSADPSAQIDRRLTLAAAVLLMTIEGKQS